MANNEASGRAFAALCDVMDRLRDPGGCPWDRVQTLDTLKPYLLEETYEVLHALDLGTSSDHREELGDLLFQVVFQSKVRSEEPGGFTAAEVADGIREKLVRRHPHVFGNQTAGTADEVLMKWEQLKRVERGGKSVLTGVPPTLPALARAQRVGEKASRVGFDWPDVKGVIAKVREELDELEEALQTPEDTSHIRAELGDILFSLAQLSRTLKFNAEDALRETIERFSARFMHLEAVLRAQGRTPEKCSPQELDALWNDAKAHEKTGTLQR